MHNYALGDFLGYYQKSWVLHPHTNEVVQVVGPAGAANSVELSDKSVVGLAELDWKHVQTPRLGFRHTNDGAQLFYVERHAGRRREKGVIPAAIEISVPAEVAAAAGVIGAKEDILNNAKLNKQLVKQLFSPTFVALPSAIGRLKSEPLAVGFALSYNWAVCLGSHKEEPFILMFKKRNVAHSVDGNTLVWYNEDAKHLFAEEFS